MKYVRQIIGALRRGEGIDLLAVVAVSLLATALSVLGLGSDRQIVGLTSTAIGLLGVAFLVQRAEMSRSAKRLELAAFGARFQDDPPFSYLNIFSESDSVFLAGLDLARTYGNYEHEIRAFLRRGGTLRVLLYNHTGSALDYAVERSKRPFSKERQAALILSAIEDFQQLEDYADSDRFQLRLSDFPFPNGVVAADYDMPQGFVCLKHYAYRADSYDKPWMRVTAADGKWYVQWRQELDEYWKSGLPVQRRAGM